MAWYQCGSFWEKEKPELCQALKKGDKVYVLKRSYKQWILCEVDSVDEDWVTVVSEELWSKESLHRHSVHILPFELEHKDGCMSDVTEVYKKCQLLLLKDNDSAEKSPA